MFNKYSDSIQILSESGKPTMSETKEIRMMLEDMNSPVRMKYSKKIYDSVINKKHVNFDGIELSKGDIRKYVGYTNMKDTLDTIKKLDVFQKTDVVKYVDVIFSAISNLEILSNEYEMGFSKGIDYVMMEYNAFVYACVEATTTLLYEYVDIIKKPNDTIEIALKNTRYRANLLYIQQLEKFNNVCRENLSDYKKFLLSLITGEKDNFVGSAMVTGFATIALIAATIVPISRELVYRHYNSKRKLSEALAQQAYFLELNKTVLERNSTLTVDKKKQILMKQEKLQKLFVSLSDKLRVDDVKADKDARRQLDLENKNLTVDKIRNEINTQPIQLL